jgi:hypothetical protein
MKKMAVILVGETGSLDLIFKIPGVFYGSGIIVW